MPLITIEMYESFILKQILPQQLQESIVQFSLLSPLSRSLSSSFPGAVLMLKGSVLRFSFLDLAGALIQSPYEVWRDPNAPEDPDRQRKRKLVHFSPSSSQDASGDGHLAVVCSERQAKVFLMPSQSCLFVHNITESSFVLRADVVSVCNSVCLACFCANGHVMTLRYSAASCPFKNAVSKKTPFCEHHFLLFLLHSPTKKL